MYESFYGLKDRPFSIIPNPDVLYMSEKHKSAFAHVQYGLMEGTGVVVLTGDVGTGKTTLIRYLLARLHPTMEVAVVFNTNVTGAELLRLIIQDFEIGEPSDDKAANIAQLHDFLLQNFSRGRKALVIIDEAQNLSAEALEEIRLLSNLQGSSAPLLQIVLVGQPELRSKLADPRLKQLAQRVTSTFHLEGLSDEEVREYVHYRLTQAGGKPDLFDDSALAAIIQSSHGIPRVINILCNGALVLGFAEEARVITNVLIEEVLRETGSMMHGGVPADARVATAVDKENLDVFSQRIQALDEKISVMQAEFDRLSLEIKGAKSYLSKLYQYNIEREKAVKVRFEVLEKQIQGLETFAGSVGFGEDKKIFLLADQVDAEVSCSDSTKNAAHMEGEQALEISAEPSPAPGFWSRLRQAFGGR